MYMYMGGRGMSMLLGWIHFFIFCPLSASVLHTCIFMYVLLHHKGSIDSVVSNQVLDSNANFECLKNSII